jgi:hypothetical protein
VAVGLVGAPVHHDAALEDAARLIVEHTLEDFAARGLRLQVLDQRGVVAVLLAAHQVGAVHPAACAFALQADMDLVARQLGAERKGKADEGGLAVEPHVARGEVSRRRALGLHLDMVEPGALGDADLGGCIGEVGLLAQADEMLDQHGPAVGLEQHQQARVIGDGVIAEAAQMKHLDRFAQDRAAADPQHHAVFHQGCVERQHRLSDRMGDAAEIRLQAAGIASDRLGQRLQADAGRQIADARKLRIEAALGQDQAPHVLARGQERRDPIQSDYRWCRDLMRRGEGHFLQGAQVGVLPGFGPWRRQAVPAELVDAGLAELAQPGEVGAGQARAAVGEDRLEIRRA